MATIARGSKASGGTTFVDNSIAYGSEVETDFATVYNAWNNHDAGTSSWTVVRVAIGSAAAPTFSFQNDTNTGIYSANADEIDFSCGGAARLTLSTTELTVLGGVDILTNNTGATIGSSTQYFAQVFVGSGSASAPAFVFGADTSTDTGMYRDAENSISFTCGGTQRGAFTIGTGATNTSLWVYDGDVSALRQVTTGADDSGGAGFKVLRIPNS